MRILYFARNAVLFSLALCHILALDAHRVGSRQKAVFFWFDNGRFHYVEGGSEMGIDHERILLNFHLILMTILFRLIALLKFLIEKIGSKGHNGIDGIAGIKGKFPTRFSLIVNGLKASLRMMSVIGLRMSN